MFSMATTCGGQYDEPIRLKFVIKDAKWVKGLHWLVKIIRVVSAFSFCDYQEQNKRFLRSKNTLCQWSEEIPPSRLEGEAERFISA